jgi:hypothetical protein
MTKEQLNEILAMSEREFQSYRHKKERVLKQWSKAQGDSIEKTYRNAHPLKPKIVEPQEDTINTIEAVDAWVKASSNIALDAQNSLIERFNPEKVQDGTLDNARAYIAKNADSKVRFVFEILSDRRPHHKRDINQAMRDNGWVDDNDCRKYVSQIRDYLALSASHYMIPDCPPGKPAIYQIILRK